MSYASLPIVKAEDVLAALDVKVDYDFQVKWNKQIKAAYAAGAPEDTKLALVGAIRAVFPIFIPGPTGAANAKNDPKGSGAFVSTKLVPELHGFYRLVVENDTARLHEEGEDKEVLELIWEGKGEQYGLDGNWRVHFH